MIRLLLILIASSFAIPHSSFAAEPRPNILHILADDMGWNALSCYGNKDLQTPHLDRLAAQGMRFTQAYADAQCSPTRAAFLSGQYGARTGVFKVLNEKEPSFAPMRSAEAKDALGPETATLATMLRKAAYTTGISGKWHIAHNYAVAALRKREGYFDSHGFDFAGPANGNEHHEDKTVTAITDDIIGFIESNRSKPWFAFVSHFSPHTKLEAPEALIAKHVARGFKRSANDEGSSSERPIANYLAMLEHLDNEVGRLLAKLDALKLSDNTLGIFTSDNGGLNRVTNNAPLREGKGSPQLGKVAFGPAAVPFPRRPARLRRMLRKRTRINWSISPSALARTCLKYLYRPASLGLYIRAMALMHWPLVRRLNGLMVPATSPNFFGTDEPAYTSAGFASPEPVV